VIDDVNKDRKEVIKKARNIKDESNHNHFSKNIFDNKYNKFCNLKEELNNKYSESLKIVFGDFSWKELIGLYLRFSRTENFQKIIKKLNYDLFKFNYEEYSQYLNFIEEAIYLYQLVELDSEIIF
jgi:hypothetical protein